MATPTSTTSSHGSDAARVTASAEAAVEAVDAFSVRGFLYAHAAMVGVLAVVLLVVEGIGEWPAIPLAAVTAMACGWAGLGERRGRAVPEWVWAVLAVMWVGLIVVDPLFLQGMFTLFPTTYAVVSWPLAIAASALMPITWSIVVYRFDESVWEWTLLPFGVWALSCSLSYWVLRVIVQSEERATILADLAATRAELAEAQRAEGAREERDRMARDIHDTLAQGFSSIVLHSRGALARGDSETARRTLELVEQVASEHLDEARRLVATSSHGSLGGRTLAEALQRVAEADEPTAHVHLDGDGQRLSGAIEVALLRITQEAVANARKHADADRIDITLAYTDREVLLDVVDDGAGFDVDTPPTSIDGDGDAAAGGYGLIGIRSRVAELGGSVVVESSPAEGTSVSVALPTGVG